MEEIVKRAIENSFESKPLISLRIWIGVGLLLILLTVWTFVNPQSSDKSDVGAFKWIGDLFSSIKLPSLDFPLDINVYVIAAASLAFVLLTLFDLVLFRKK